MDVNVPQDSHKLIKNLADKYPSYKSTFEEIDSNLSQSLWYQLSENLILISLKPELQNSKDLIELYNGLIFFYRVNNESHEVSRIYPKHAQKLPR